MKNLIFYQILLLTLIILFLGCGTDVEDDQTGPKEILIATIYENKIETSIFFDNGFSKFKIEKELVNEVNVSFSDNNPYFKKEVESTGKFDDGTKWIPFWDESGTDIFKIESNFELQDPLALSKDIGILPYLDPNNNNKKNIGIELWAYFDPKSHPNGAHDEYDKIYFYMGKDKSSDPFRLKCSVVKKVINDYGEEEESIKTTDLFRVRIDSDNEVKIFGDDMVLNFKMKQNNGDEIKTFDLENGETNEHLDNFISFFALYDDKFLKKANQSIDEGNDDWNEKWDDIFQAELPSWTHWDDDAPENTVEGAVPYSWGGSDSAWDFIHDMEEQQKALNAFIEGGWNSTLAPDDDWSKYISGKNNSDNKPFKKKKKDFVKFLTDDGSVSGIFEKTDKDDKVLSHEVIYEEISLSEYIVSIDYVLDINDTEASVNMKVKRKDDSDNSYIEVPLEGSMNTTNGLTPGTWIIRIEKYGNLVVNYDLEYTITEKIEYTEEYEPYRPGYTTTLSDDEFTMNHTIYSAGTDCSGFVCQASNYPGEQYKIGKSFLTTSDRGLQREVWEETGEYVNSGYKLATSHYNTSYAVSILQNELVPGDLLLITNHATEGNHVVIVQDVIFSKPTGASDYVEREVSKPNVYIIEAARGDDEWCILNRRSWAANTTADRDGLPHANSYVPRRLKVNGVEYE